jgi:hypothetical protein
MKLKQLYSDIDNNIIDTIYNKLKKFKLKNRINTKINDYKISYHKLNINLPLDTRYTILKQKFDLSNYTQKKFSIYWDKNFDSLNKWFNYLQNYKNFSSKIDTLIYNKLVLSKFISQNLINDIITNCKYYCTIIGNNRNIMIYGKTKSEIKKYIIKTLQALDFFNIFYYDKTQLNLFIFLSKIKKKFPNDNFYTPYHVNTAYSISKTEIAMFRTEEFEKVLFHELIHFYQLDIYNYQNAITNKLPKFKFKINPNEAYTDFIAIILHILYVKYITNKSLKQLIKMEVGYINHQVKKILKLANSNNITNLVKNFNQSTSVFSYFILKSSMFNNINLLNTLDINNLSCDYLQIYNSFINKKWNNRISKNKNLLKNNSLKMSYISKFLD